MISLDLIFHCKLYLKNTTSYLIKSIKLAIRTYRNVNKIKKIKIFIIYLFIK